MRAVPDQLPGKTRLARIALRPFLDSTPMRVPDRFGNLLHLPSLAEPISLGLFACGVYEPDTVRAILDHLGPSGIFLDIGANVGAVALAVAASRPDARVICVEGDPQIASLLHRNAAANERSNIEIINCLAGPDNDPQVPFYRAPAAKYGMGSIGPQFDTLPVALAQRPIDEVLDESGIDAVDVVKLDVEGSEFGALRGLRRRLAGQHRPVIVFEFADWAETRIAGQSAGCAQQLLLSLGYNLFRLTHGGRPGLPIERPITIGSAMILALPARGIRRSI